MEAFEFLRNRQLLSPDQSLHETAMPNYTWGDLIQLLDDYLKANSSQLEPLVMQKIADVIKKEAEEWNITIHCKNIEESALFSSIARDQVKLFAEYIANFILDKEG